MSSTQQTKYNDAKAKFEKVKNEIDLQIKNFCLESGIDSTKRDPRTRDKRNELEVTHKYTSLLSDLISKEDKLISWLFNKIKTLPQYKEQKEKMDKMFSEYAKSPTIKEKLVYEAMKLKLINNL